MKKFSSTFFIPGFNLLRFLKLRFNALFLDPHHLVNVTKTQLISDRLENVSIKRKDKLNSLFETLQKVWEKLETAQSEEDLKIIFHVLRSKEDGLNKNLEFYFKPEFSKEMKEIWDFVKYCLSDLSESFPLLLWPKRSKVSPSLSPELMRVVKDLKLTHSVQLGNAIALVKDKGIPIADPLKKYGEKTKTIAMLLSRIHRQIHQTDFLQRLDKHKAHIL